MKILTFNIGCTNIRYALCDDSYHLTDRHTIPSEINKGGQNIINRLIEIIKEYDDIDRIAISTVGQVDSENGIVVYSSNSIPYYTGMMVKKIIENKTGIPAFVENDVNAAAIAQAQFGEAKNTSDFLCLTYGTGIGGAFYHNNKLYKGHTSAAGEIGHMITHVGGKECACKNKGCYECYASAKALVDAVFEATGETHSALSIFEKENFQRYEIRTVVDNWIDEIISGLINLIYIFNPPLIILGGGIMNEDYIIDLIDRKIYKRLMPSYKKVNIVRSHLGADAPMLGAAFAAHSLQNSEV